MSTTNTVSDKDIKNLKKHISEKRSREKQCANILEDFAYVLTSHLPSNPVYIESELTTSAGRLDLIIIVNSPRISGTTRKKVYVWELKAPQLNIYDINTKSRAQPSSSYWEAENQLLHYHYELKSNTNWLTQHSIQTPDDIHLGGIIIGSNTKVFKKKTKTLVSDNKAILMCDTTHRVRESYLSKDFALLTWDDVLNRLVAHKNATVSASVSKVGKVKKAKKQSSNVTSTF